MACPNANLVPFIRIINNALVLAGVLSPGQPATDADERLGLDLLNQLLGLWSGQNQYLFFVDVVYHTVIESKEAYTIGTDSSNDIVANPFYDITSLNYRVGNIDYGCQFTPYKSYNLIPIKSIVAYPTNFNYEYYGSYTQLRIFPQPQEEMILRISGKQVLSDVTLFSNSASLPGYVILPLTYALARHLVNFGRGNVQPQFYHDHDNIMCEFISANKQDVQYEVNPAFNSSKSGSRFGIQGGGGNY